MQCARPAAGIPSEATMHAPMHAQQRPTDQPMQLKKATSSSRAAARVDLFVSLPGRAGASLRCERFGAAHVRMDPCDPCRRDRRSVSGSSAAVRARCAYVYVRTRATGCLMLCCFQTVLPRDHLPTGGREQRKHTRRTGMHSLSAPMPG